MTYKIVYFICAVPVFLFLMGTGIHMGYLFAVPVGITTAISMVFDVIALIFIYAFLQVNYYFIKNAYKKNFKEKKAVTFISCLTVLSCLTFFFPAPYDIAGIIIIVLSMLINLCILLDNKEAK